MGADPLDQRGASDDDPGLRAAEEFVAAEAADIDTGANRVADRRLGGKGIRMRKGLTPDRRRIVTEVAAAEIFGDGGR